MLTVGSVRRLRLPFRRAPRQQLRGVKGRGEEALREGVAEGLRGLAPLVLLELRDVHVPRPEACRIRDQGPNAHTSALGNERRVPSAPKRRQSGERLANRRGKSEMRATINMDNKLNEIRQPL